MILNSRRLGKAAVRTRSGARVGNLASIDLDGDTGKLVAIRVLPRGSVGGLLSNELVIAWHLIVSMTEEEVVVEDATVPYAIAQFASKVAMKDA